ncbi:MAG: hypothetical protein V9E94_15465 [Microthrixaceae bacterium]
MTTGADPVFVEDKVASPLVRSTVVAAGESLVEVSADRGWMSSLPPAAFPVVIDPDLAIGPTWWASYLGGVPSSTCGVAPACGHRAGHPMIPGYPWSMWRSLNIFDLASVASAYQLTGGNYPRLLSAQVGLNRTAGSTASTQVNLHVPNAYSWEGVTGGGLLGSATSTSSYVYDVTGHMHGKLAASDTGFAFGLASDASVYNYKQFDFGLFLVVNDRAAGTVGDRAAEWQGMVREDRVGGTDTDGRSGVGLDAGPRVDRSEVPLLGVDHTAGYHRLLGQRGGESVRAGHVVRVVAVGAQGRSHLLLAGVVVRWDRT